MWDRRNLAFRVQKVAPQTCNKMHGWLTHFCGILALNNTQAHAQKGETITGDYQSIKTTNNVHEFARKKFEYPINEKSTLKLCDSTEYAWNCPKHEYSISSTQNLPQQKSSKWQARSSFY